MLYSNGGGSAVNVNTLEFKPDLIWVKSRNANANHGLYDSLRGDNKRIVSDLTNTESTVVGPVPSDSGFSIAGSHIIILQEVLVLNFCCMVLESWWCSNKQTLPLLDRCLQLGL